MHIDMGYDERYSVTNIGAVTFQRESVSSLRLKDVMFVLSQKKNLISIEVLEDHGYNVLFNKGKELLRHVKLT